MEKKYQVFVSSTYQDLKDERKEVIQALLELDCIPVGMEMFPATDDEQWTLIKDLIDDCDYYVLILAGRYGSENEDGMGYTQMEYEYAISIGIPTISFLYKDIEQLPVSKTDKNAGKEAKLKVFRDSVQKKLVRYWNSPEDLGSAVSRSLVKLIKTKPRIGWVKADSISSTEANIQILELKQRIQELEEELTKNSELSIDDLSQGNDKVSINYVYKVKPTGNYQRSEIEISWNSLLAKTGTFLMHDMSESDYAVKVGQYISHLLAEGYYEVTPITDSFKSIIIQYKALGIIEKSKSARSVKDTNTYWKLTEKGDELLTKLRAIKRTNKNED